MLRQVPCGASICTLVQRPDRVKGGPGEHVPGLREVGGRNDGRKRGSGSQQAGGPEELDFAMEQFLGTRHSSQQMPQMAPTSMWLNKFLFFSTEDKTPQAPVEGYGENSCFPNGLFYN